MNTKKLKNLELPVDKYKFLGLTRDNFSKKYYQNILAYDLILKQNYTSIMQLPRVEKILLNTTSKTYVTDKKYILFTLAALELLSGQKPQLTYAQKSIANFKIRQHQIMGCRVVLRENQMYTFLDKLSKIIFPRIRDYSKRKLLTQINTNALFTSNWHLDKNTKMSAHTFGFQNLMIFPELENHFELVDNFRGMNLTFVLSNSNKTSSRLLLSAFQLPLFF